MWLADLRRAGSAVTTWVLEGYLAPANVSVLTSQWKAGKTTLLSVLLARMHSGGALAGFQVTPGKAAVVSEELPALWRHRADKLAYGDSVCWFCRPFSSPPSAGQWLGLRDRLMDVHGRVGLQLVAIDSLACLAPPGVENCPRHMLDFLSTLRPLTAANIAVLLLHHPSKKDLGPGMAARGTGVLSSFADILIEMRWYGRASDTNRRRRLLAFSRHEATPRQRVIELSADGADYVTHGDYQDDQFAYFWLVLKGVLEAADKKLTRPEIAKSWPPDLVRPTRMTLWRWLDRAVNQGLLLRDGSGWKTKPFRYWLPGQEAKWPQAYAGMEEWLDQIETANAHVMLQPSHPLPPPPE
jgi:hypothetical protein